MASRRQKKKVHLRHEINKLKNIYNQREDIESPIKPRNYTKKELKRLQSLTGIKPLSKEPIRFSKSYIEKKEKEVNWTIHSQEVDGGGFYTKSLIERYYELVDAGYIEPTTLTAQQVYHAIPTIMEEQLSEDELSRIVKRGEQRMEKARERNLRAREKETIVFDF